MMFKTEIKVGKTGVMLVGLGGNNGSTCAGGSLANKMNLAWETKLGEYKANYMGSMMMASTVKLGNDAGGNTVHTPMSNMLPMVDPNEINWGGWDISRMILGNAIIRAKVLDIDLQRNYTPQ